MTNPSARGSCLHRGVTPCELLHCLCDLAAKEAAAKEPKRIDQMRFADYERATRRFFGLPDPPERPIKQL